MEANICRNCGSFKLVKTGGLLKCQHCELTYSIESEQKIFDKLYEALNELDKKEVANLKNKLYETLKEDYPNAQEVVSICQEIRTHVFDDFVASFYYHAYEIKINHNAIRHYAEFINDIDVVENYPFIEKAITVATLDLKKELVLPVTELINRAASKNVISVEKKRELISALEIESQNLDNDVYNPKVTRDFFIMHSGRDIQKVLRLVANLEEQNRTCFVAQRNIQHGRGSSQEYNEILKVAMDHCRWVIFVSSTNSRDHDCQAVDFEMEYIKDRDIKNAPAELRFGDYKKIPYTYKKPRIEYLIEEYKGVNHTERTVKEFFNGLEYVLEHSDVSDLLDRFYGGWPPKPIPVPGSTDDSTPVGGGEKHETEGNRTIVGPLNEEQREAKGEWGPVEPYMKDLLDAAMEVIEKNKDYDEAFEIYSEAAEDGNLTAICNLGYMYEAGLGVDRDVYKAVEYYTDAAEKGNARAMYNLGVCYELGVGILRNETKAAEWFKKAAEKGDSYAKKKLIGA